MDNSQDKRYPCQDLYYYDSVYNDGECTLPTAVRQYLDIEDGNPLYFIVDAAARTVRLEKSAMRCVICGSGGELGIVNHHFVCRICVEELLAHPPQSFLPE